MTATYEPLADVRKTFRVDWYRCPIDPAALRTLMRRSDVQGWLQAGGHLALFGCTALLTAFFFVQQMWVGFFIALWLHGTVGSFFKGLAVHELGHGITCKRYGGECHEIGLMLLVFMAVF